MSWHHILPFYLLRDVWNRLVDQHIGTEFAEARVAIRQYLLLADRSLPNLENMIDRMRAENNTQKRAGTARLEPLNVAEAHQLGTAAVWPAWSAVEGPKNRSDDPHDRYFDRFTFGLTSEEARRMNTIEGLFSAFQRFVDTGPAPGPGNLRALGEAASFARSTLAGAQPIRYRADMWVQDHAGLWRKRRAEDRSAGIAG